MLASVMQSLRRDWLALLFLAAITSAALAGVCGNGFINFDDSTYVTQNPYLRAGFTGDTWRWAWTDFRYCMWCPLTRLSLVLDHAWSGIEPWGYHLTNLLLHLGSVGLVFVLFRRLTGRFWESLVLAALFGVHPLRVESVAWVAERKDTLSTFLGLAALCLYSLYVARPGLLRYGLTVLVFVLALLAKPMLVTLPFVLLLLDYWPLGWLDSASWRTRILEKLPFLAIALIFAIVTVVTHRDMGAMDNLESVPFAYRCGNAVLSYGKYIGQTVWPSGLSIHYSHPRLGLSWPTVAAVAALLLAITVMLVRQASTRPALLVGWLWFLGTLVPVIGLVPNNDCAFAGRYSYMPQIGLLLMLIWGGAELLARLPSLRLGLGVAAAAALLACSAITFQEVGYWRDNETLWAHALAVDDRDGIAETNYAFAIVGPTRLAESQSHLENALRRNPGNILAHVHLALVLWMEGNLPEAESHCRAVLRSQPEHSLALARLGRVLASTGRLQEARQALNTALKLSPNLIEAHQQLGFVLLAAGDLVGAETHLRVCLDATPDDPDLHLALSSLCLHRGELAEAESHLRQAMQLGRSDAYISNLLGMVLQRQGKLS
jgi:protein O-mannosyl-transferase